MAEDGTAAPTGAWRRLTRLPGTIRGRMLLLAFAVILPAVLATSLLLWDVWRAHRAETTRQMHETARALTVAIDRQTGQAEATLRALATSPYLETGDYAAFDRQARQVAGTSDSWIVLTDATGAQRVNTREPFGAALPATPGPGFAERWSRLRVEGRLVSDLFTGRVSRGPAVAVEIPVLRNGAPVYDLQLVTSPHVPAQVFIDQHLAKGWVAGVMDRQGRLIARSRDTDRFVGRQAKPEVVRQIQSEPQSTQETVTADGVPVLTVRNRSALSGWTVFVAIPKDELNAAVTRAVALASVLVLGLMALGAGLAVWVARGVVGPVEALSGAAEALGRGERVALASAGIAETDAVADALTAAAGKLKAREDELTHLNETLEARVQDGAERLVQAQKLEAVGRLTGGVAHDFNNLLTAVLGNLELLGRRLSDERLRRYVTNARDAAQRGAALTGQLLAFARKQRLTPEAIDLNEVVAGMTGLLASTLGGAVKVETDLCADLAPALADRTQLELTVLNLAINARDAMPNGGALRILTAEVHIEAQPVRASDPPPGRYVRLTVTDQGVGMTAEVMERVLEPFFTTKAPGKGSGLGLPHVLGVVQQLGGGLQIESAPGEGATIHVFLPPALGHAAPAPAEGAHAPRSLSGRTILLVDDDLQVRRTVAALLWELGAVAVEADGPRAARAHLSSGLDFDLALLDYAMPEANGAELAQDVAAVRPQTPTVLMTGYADGAELTRTWTGAVLQKPFTAEVLGEVLGRVLSRPHSSEPA